MIPAGTNKELSGRTIANHLNANGLLNEEVITLQKQFGKNIFRFRKEHRFVHIVWDIVREPMFILLAIACGLYFILGETDEGIMMAIAMIIIMAISVYQEAKSSKAIRALKNFTEPKTPVIRNNKEQLINSEELVPGDIMLLEEGMRIPADALIIQQNDLTVDESLLTGESVSHPRQIIPHHNFDPRLTSCGETF